MKCILHIGMHKTGSSSIQSSLKNYDDGETAYAQLPGDENHSVQLHNIFSENYQDHWIWKQMGASPNDINAARDNLERGLNQQLEEHDGKNLIFSGEGMSMMAPDSAEALVDFMQERFDEVKVIAYVRDPMEYAASAFQQQVRRGLRDVRNVGRARYREKIEKYLAPVGKDNIVVKQFSPDKLVEGDVVKDFCATANLDYELTEPTVQNVGLNQDVTKILYCLNRNNPLSSGEPDILMWNDMFRSAMQLTFTDGKKLPKDIFSAVADFDDLDWLSDEFGIHFHSNHLNVTTPEALDEWLCYIPEDMTSKLKAFLRLNGVTVDFDDNPSMLVSRIFCLFVQGYKLSSRDLQLTYPGLTTRDAQILNKVALKHETNEPITRLEAMALMLLAIKANPDVVSQAKLKQWLSTANTSLT